jgi:ectoine hydroxylase-related dioxygenase (phytanoyl-CoA dioxygenase family)
VWLQWSALDRDPRITVYLAIDAATEENGCMHIVPGS